MPGSIRIAASAVLLGASLTACTTGSDPTPAVTAQAASGAPATPSASSSSSADGIPASALLQPADVRGAEPTPIPEGNFPHLRPVRPCDEPYPSDDTREQAVAVSYFLEPAGEGDGPSTITEFVGQHADGGAAAQFKDITAALERCPGELAEGKRKWTVLDTGIAGDESVLVRYDQLESYGDEEDRTVGRYAAVAREGERIIVVGDLGWENIGGSQKLVTDLIGKAVERAS